MPSRILVVDDEPDLELLIRQKFRRQIRSGDLAFAFAGDGVEALERLDQDAEIGLVLSDINMPHMDGLTLLEEIQTLDRPLRVVIVSAYGDMSNIRTAMNRGAFDFITKPIDFEDLAATILKTQRDLEALQQAAALETRLTAIQRELEIASQIQLSVLPSQFPAFPERTAFDLHATMIPAREVGGDFYDFFLLGDDRLGFVLGDVSGKGVGAALFMAITRTMLRATALQGAPVAECVAHVNRVLHPESLPRMFVTLVYGVLDARTGELTYCNAGHHPPYLLRRGEAVRAIDRTGGLGLCLAAEFEYRAGHLTLQPGDSLVLFSDGITEAVDADSEQFAEARLEGCLQRINGQEPAVLIRDVLRAVEAFSGGAAQSDDMTLLAVRYYGDDLSS
jgi:sigma-B regulation protein RsbU (phosphoserine phosphatase)